MSEGQCLALETLQGGDVEDIRLQLTQGGINYCCYQSGSYGPCTALMVASENGRSDLVRLLLDEGAEVGVENSIGQSALHIASHEGHFSVVELLFDRGAPLDAQDSSGWSALMHASSQGHLDVAKLLVEIGAGVNLLDTNEWSSLMLASSEGHCEIVELLLSEGAMIDHMESNGWSSLMLASREGNSEMVELLLNKGAQMNLQDCDGFTALAIAIHYGHPEVVLVLDDNGAQADYRFASSKGKAKHNLLLAALDTSFEAEGSALMYASGGGFSEIISLLLERGAMVDDLHGSTGWSPLMLACSNGHFDVAASLIEKGACVNLQGGGDCTALMLAVESGHCAIAEFLLGKGAQVDLQDSDGQSSLLIACEEMNSAMIRVLLDWGANADLQNNHGQSALIVASSRVDCELTTLQLLLENGAQVDLVDDNGWSALMHASKLYFTTSKVEVLIDGGADVNLQNNSGESALLVACKKSHKHVMELLLNRGANIDIQDRNGLSALLVACENHESKIMKLLLSRGANIDIQNKDGESPLIMASRGHLTIDQDFGYEDGASRKILSIDKYMVRMLLDRGATVDLQDARGWSALMYMSEQGDYKAVELLLQYSPQLDLQNEDGCSALMVSSKHGCYGVAQLLLDRGAMVDLQDGGGWSALMHASSAGYDAVTALLLNSAAAVDLQTGDGLSALMYACIYGHQFMCQLLLNSGAQVNLNDTDGLTALMYASKHGHSGATKMLLSFGADVHQKDKNGRSAVEFAQNKEHFEVATMLTQTSNLPNAATKVPSLSPTTPDLEMVTPEDAGNSEAQTTLYGEPRMASITSDTPVVDMPDLGVSLSVQRPLTEAMSMLVHPCLPGSFVLPDGHTAASPVYLIQHRSINNNHYILPTDLTVSIQHCVVLKSKEACKHMTFLSARIKSRPPYPFTGIRGTAGQFKKGSTVGKIALKELNFFVVVATTLKPGSNSLYSLRLLPTVIEESLVEAVLYSCWNHPLYEKHSDKAVAQIMGTTRQPDAKTAMIISGSISLAIQQPMRWNVKFDGENEICPSEGVNNTLSDCPPMIRVSVQKRHHSEESCAKFHIIGLDREIIFGMPPFRGDATEEESARFIKAIEQAIAKSGKINRRLAHSMFIGPPGSGKSSLIDRLLKRLRRKIAKSTGVCNSVIIVDINEINPSSFHTATGMDSETWKEIDYEVSIINQLGEKSGEEPSSRQVVNENVASQSKPANKKLDQQRGEVSTKAKFFKLLPRRPKKKHADKYATPPTPASKKTQAAIVFAMSSESVTSIIKKYGFETFANYLQKTFSLYIRDTGGQVEFQEMLPLIIFGPSIFFFVFRTDLDFQSKFTVEYRTGEGESINSYTSSITTEEALVQCLASVYAMDTSTEAAVKTHKPLVFIVGTHVDQLGPSPETRISELNQQIDSLIQNNGFQDIVQYADKHSNQVFFPVDNTSESDEDFKSIRSSVNSLIYGREEFTIKYPISYLLLCLDLQKEKRKVLTLDEFRIIAARHGIEGDNVLHLLQFLHLRIGIVRYYDVEGLRDIVVIEPQILFNTITDLVVKTFSCRSLTSSEMEEFEKKGLFTASVLESVIGASDLRNEISSSDQISAKKFLQLLVHLRIITPFTTPRDEEKKYFIPCVLNHVSESSEEGLKTDVQPLAVKFQCRHCPKGVFGVLVTHLMTPELNRENDNNTKFTLMQNKIFKDQVSFEVTSYGFHDELSLKIHMSHLELNFLPDLSEDRDCAFEDVCCSVRNILEESILASLKDLHYSEEKVQPEMCFRCQDCRELHPVTRGKEFHRIYCNTTHRSSRIPSQGRCWYGEFKATGTTAKANSDDCPTTSEGAVLKVPADVSSLPASARPHLERQLDWDNEGVDRDLTEISDHMLHWEGKLSAHLGLTEVDIHDIKENLIYISKPPLQRKEALRRWKCKQGLHATYGNLLELFTKAGHTRCAEVVCEVLRNKNPITCQDSESHS